MSDLRETNKRIENKTSGSWNPHKNKNILNIINMQTTEHFKQAIRNYLQGMAAEDEIFAQTFSKPEKNIDDCTTYILNKVMQSKCNGFTDSEIYSMAVHYYEEDDIEVGKPIDHAQIVVNHVVELTDEEKAEARHEAMAQYQRDCYNRIANRHKPQPKREQTTQVQQLSLFD